MARPLLRWLLTAPIAGRAGLLAARAAGSMLAALQHVPIDRIPHGPSFQPADSRYRLALAQRLERAARAGVPATLLAAAERIIDVGKLVQRVRLVTQHSDFAPWNIIIERQYCATLVDLHNLTVGVPEYDLAYFVTALDLYRRFGAVRDSRVAALKSAFLEAYHDNKGSGLRDTALIHEQDAPRFTPFDILCVMHAFYFAPQLMAAPSARPLWVLRPVDNRRFVFRWLEGLLAHFN
jgi:hypothetical protein